MVCCWRLAVASSAFAIAVDGAVAALVGPASKDPRVASDAVAVTSAEAAPAGADAAPLTAATPAIGFAVVAPTSVCAGIPVPGDSTSVAAPPEGDKSAAAATPAAGTAAVAEVVKPVAPPGAAESTLVAEMAAGTDPAATSSPGSVAARTPKPATCASRPRDSNVGALATGSTALPASA